MVIVNGILEVVKILIPDLTGKSFVVMDNAAFHKNKKIKTLLESKGTHN